MAKDFFKPILIREPVTPELRSDYSLTKVKLNASTYQYIRFAGLFGC